MPTNDWSKDQDDEDDQESGSGGSGSSAGATGTAAQAGGQSTAVHSANPSAQQTDGYTPWSSFMAANSGVIDRESGKVANQVQGDAQQTSTDISNLSKANTNQDSSNYNDWKTPQNTEGYADGRPVNPKGAPKGAAAVTTVDASASPYDQILAPVVPQQPELPPKKNPQPPPPPSPMPPAPPGGSAVTATKAQLPDQIAKIAPPVTTPLQATATPANVIAKFKGPPDLMQGQLMGSAVSGGIAGLRGAPDLATAAGTDAWSKLLAEGTNADNEAGAIGNEKGVEALLQQGNQYGPENTAFDAALLNSKAGDQFRGINAQYGNGQLDNQLTTADQKAQDQWSKLLNDYQTQQPKDEGGVDAEASAIPQKIAQITPTSPTDKTNPLEKGSGWAPPNADSYANFMNPANSGMGTAHYLAMMASPADWATFGLGYGAGMNVPNASQAFASAEKASGDGSDWMHGNLMLALTWLNSNNHWSQEALNLWYKNLTPDEWNQYSQYNNGGIMAKNIEKWMNDNGINHNYPNPDVSQGDAKAAATSSNQAPGRASSTGGDAPTWATQGSADFNQDASDARDQAYKDGWGARFDADYVPGQPLPTY